MSKHHLIVAALALASSAAAQVRVFTPENTKQGDSIDVIDYSVGYEQTFFKGMGKSKGKPLHEQMKLDIGGKTAHFYSYAAFQCDSIADAQMAKGNFNMTRTAQIMMETYTDYPAVGQYSMTDLVGMDGYLLQESMPVADWELCPDSVATVLGYTCRMAKTTFLGREWSAWYAEDIPLDNGPWLLRGLPGLILRAYTADGLFRFDANGLEKGVGRKPMYYKGGECEKLSREQLVSLYYRYHTDPIGYINSNSKIKIQILDENRNEVTKKMKTEYFLLDATLQKR